MLIDTVKADLLTARKARADKVRISILGNVVDGADKLAKKDQRPINDDDVIKSIKGLLAGLVEMVELGNVEVKATSQHEIDIIKPYLPTLVADEVVQLFIKSFVDNTPDAKIGQLQQQLRDKFGKLFDAGMASRYFTEITKK